MKEVLLVRHAQSYANKGDFAAFANVDSPLTPKGMQQIKQLTSIFEAEYCLDPLNYDRPVLASEYTRTQQSAAFTGFRDVHVSALINESDIASEHMTGAQVVAKHAAERWAPEATKERAAEFLTKLIADELTYQVYFTHGMFIGPVLLECESRGIEFDREFDEQRGYVPLQGGLTRLFI